jgi:hypothetical protein
MHQLTGHGRRYYILADHVGYTMRNASSTRRLRIDDGVESREMTIRKLEAGMPRLL